MDLAHNKPRHYTAMNFVNTTKPIQSFSIKLFISILLTGTLGCSEKNKSEDLGQKVPTLKAPSAHIPPKRTMTRAANCERISGTEVQIHNLTNKVLVEIDLWRYFYSETNMTGSEGKTLKTSVAPQKKQIVSISTSSDRYWECEVTQALFGDGEQWMNPNLLYTPTRPRPRSGEQASSLDEKEQAPASAQWNGDRTSPKATYVNKSGRPLIITEVRVHYFNKEGDVFRRSVNRQSLSLNRGAQSTAALPPVPTGAVHIQVIVSSVTYADGTQETWSTQG